MAFGRGTSAGFGGSSTGGLAAAISSQMVWMVCAASLNALAFSSKLGTFSLTSWVFSRSGMAHAGALGAAFSRYLLPWLSHRLRTPVLRP